MENITAAAPAQIDAQIAQLQSQSSGFISSIVRGQDELHYLARDRRETGTYGRGPWKMTHEEAAVAAAAFAPGSTRMHQEKIAAARVDLAGVREQLETLDAEFDRRGGWSRFFMAQSTGGHIHSSTECSTCNRAGKPTSFGWMTELSGQSEEQAVAEGGPVLCTVCFRCD